MPLIESARLCGTFGDTPPVSLSYFTPASSATTLQFYVTKQGKPEEHSELFQRTRLGYNNGKIQIILSPDDKGTQVDILIKPTQT